MSQKERREMRQITALRAHFDKTQAARTAVAKTIKQGELVRQPCAVCGKLLGPEFIQQLSGQRTFLFGRPIGLAVTLRPTPPRRIRHVSRLVRAAKECLADLQ